MMTYALRAKAKRVLPEGVRRRLRMLETYVKRLLLWPIILVQVRGASPEDQRKLILSALAAPVLSFRNLDQWQDPILLFDTAVSVRGVGRFRLRQRCDDLWHVLPWREREVLKFIRRTLKLGDVFIDAGANIGVYSVVAARLVGSRGRVTAVEMMPDTACRLRDHLRLNAAEQVQVIEKALAEHPGQVLAARVREGQFGQASIATAKLNDAKLRSTPIETATLGQLLQGIPHVALMKMDIEGAELLALRCAGPLIQCVDSIVFENRGTTCAVSDYLFSVGYNLQPLDGANWVASRACR